ncbi:hypothetical protein [Hydrogenophaga sp. MI9]|uniref:hypothetical protein n=1 Tax=Hydrogenophaga sp. MI9 TaxID=3453719 RepID=UPI003EF00202
MAQTTSSRPRGSVAFSGLMLAAGLLAAAPALAADDEVMTAARSCMRAWGQHPFTDTPPLRTVSGSVRVMGRGPSISDREATDFPVLVVVQPGVNVMGGSELELLNPNGWYCLRAAVNVMGGMDIKLQCNAQLASALTGTTVMSGDNAAKGVTVMGAITVQRVGCGKN